MSELIKQAGKTAAITKQRSYNEVIEYLDAHWKVEHNKKSSLDRTKKLHEQIGSPASKFKTILINGTNGKSLTAAYCTKILRLEGLSVGSFISPHILTYNERFAFNSETITNKQFVEVVNEVINAAESLNFECHSQELLVVSALNYFAQNDVDVALLEVDKGGMFNPVNICNASITAVTRITPAKDMLENTTIEEHINDLTGIVKPGSYLVTADQSKSNLLLMEEATKAHGGMWAMPIRKLAALPYPFEQLHGRCAALAERICQLFAENLLKEEVPFATDSLLIKQKGQRGRPTLEQKRQLEINPKRTMNQVWGEDSTSLPGRFQLLDKEKPSILLDTASNIDSFQNLLLGIRLLHYKKQLKGLTVIIGSEENKMDKNEFLKLVRYFFRKTSGQLLICPVNDNLPGVNHNKSWNVDQITNDIKSMKIKAKACEDFAEAFELAKKSVDDRNGLIVVTGSTTIVSEYWQHKGIKKI